MSPGNRDGSLLSDTEYAEHRSRLLKEKTTLEELIKDAGERTKQPLTLSEQAFEFACMVQERFTKGDAKARKAILDTIGSNLILKDKILLIEARKPFFTLENSLFPEKAGKPPIEPNKTVVAQRHKTYSILMRPSVLGDLDDVRTYLKTAQRAATLIYAHFKKEFGSPEKK